MKKFVISTLLLFLPISCHAFKNLGLFKGYIYEVYVPGDLIPVEQLNEALEMYYLAYCNPPLHQGIPLNELKIDGSKFSSYEGFISDMFMQDFQSYQDRHLERFYFQIRDRHSIIGICVVLKLAAGVYYIDHLGINAFFRRQGLAKHLIGKVQETCSDFVEIALDTRVFNKPAQFFYEACGFKKLTMHPNASKQSTYYRYTMTRQSGSL